MIYLDTHVLIWLYEKALEKFTDQGKQLLNSQELKISSMVRLELQYLYEIKKIVVKPDKIIDELHYQLGLSASETDLSVIVHQAMDLHWTRDPFDRLIVATSACEQATLLTKDTVILQHYKKAVW